MPPFPVAMAYLWKAYMRLRRRKSMGFNGLNKIEWPDIDAFMRASRFPLAPWEIEIIEDLDDIYCRVSADIRAGTAGTASQSDTAIADSLKSVAKQ